MKVRVPLVVSFYTKNTPYEQEADQFIASCQKHGIEYEVEGLDSLGSWDRNCAMKPSFILKKLKEKNRSVLWVDIDGRFLKPLPPFPWQDSVFSARINEFLPPHHCNRLAAGTLYCAYCPEVLDLLENWILLCEEYLAQAHQLIEVWDQQVLQEAIANFPQLRFSSLPKMFARVADYDDKILSEEEAIIKHTQASRRLKKEVNPDANDREGQATVDKILNFLKMLDMTVRIEVDENSVDHLGKCLDALGFFACKTIVVGKFTDISYLMKFSSMARIYPNIRFMCNNEFFPNSRYSFLLQPEYCIDEIKLLSWLARFPWKKLLPLRFGLQGPILGELEKMQDPRIIEADIFIEGEAQKRSVFLNAHFFTA